MSGKVTIGSPTGLPDTTKVFLHDRDITEHIQAVSWSLDAGTQEPAKVTLTLTPDVELNVLGELDSVTVQTVPAPMFEGGLDDPWRTDVHYVGADGLEHLHHIDTATEPVVRTYEKAPVRPVGIRPDGNEAT